MSNQLISLTQAEHQEMVNILGVSYDTEGNQLGQPRPLRPSRQILRKKRTRNRLRHPRDTPIRLFKKSSNPNKLADRESLRSFIIRAHKRLNRHIKDNKLPMTKHNLNHPKASDSFDKLKDIYWADRIQLSSLTQSGPLTDGKSKRIGRSVAEKSFNNAFCKRYFTELGVRKSYYYFIELMFAESKLDLLSLKFSLLCCAGKHRSKCGRAWQGLKEYLQVTLMKSIGVEPWSPLI